MPVAIEGAQLGFLTLQLDLLLAQLQDHRRGRHVADRFQGRSGTAHIADDPQLRLLGRQIRLGGDELTIEVGQFLVVERAATALDNVVRGLERRDRLVGLLHVAAQLGQPLLQPGVGLIGGAELALDLFLYVKLGDLVADHRSLGGIHRREHDLDQIGRAIAQIGDILGEVTDRFLAHDTGCLAFQDRLGLAGQPGGDQPLARQIAQHLTQRLQEAWQRRRKVRGLRGQRRVKFWVIEKIEIVHDRSYEGLGLHQPNLSSDGRRVDGKPLQHLLNVAELQLARVDHAPPIWRCRSA